MLDDAQVAVVLTTSEHEAALAPLARQAGADLRLLQHQACAPLSLHSLDVQLLLWLCYGGSSGGAWHDVHACTLWLAAR